MDQSERLVLAEKLEEAAGLEGSECGEYWADLSNMVLNSWQMSDEFQTAFDKELEATARYIEEAFEIVEQVIQRPTTIRTLEPKNGS